MPKITVIYQPAESVCDIVEPISLCDFLNSLYGAGTELEIAREDGTLIEVSGNLMLGEEDLTITIRIPIAEIETLLSQIEAGGE
jgi:hypothetical protein